ncbi:hypothetical protein CYLTODRAFT_414479 [Cylindrobasidium torrendii FP15055 ss-10]|uniref:Uncharacterized protein n=1 Tax=Cylindrobasidium torrendii FP15055 ss-10 TaxID=1314674 RepID=A0A0D7AZW3_9AGAR|nr:hypothetical protein CYLTODRAFT_414479 [Cylindrobasidium torrendii FP15055 ss-10]
MDNARSHGSGVSQDRAPAYASQRRFSLVISSDGEVKKHHKTWERAGDAKRDAPARGSTNMEAHLLGRFPSTIHTSSRSVGHSVTVRTQPVFDTCSTHENHWKFNFPSIEAHPDFLWNNLSRVITCDKLVLGPIDDLSIWSSNRVRVSWDGQPRRERHEDRIVSLSPPEAMQRTMRLRRRHCHIPCARHWSATPDKRGKEIYVISSRSGPFRLLVKSGLTAVWVLDN